MDPYQQYLSQMNPSAPSAGGVSGYQSGAGPTIDPRLAAQQAMQLRQQAAYMQQMKLGQPQVPPSAVPAMVPPMQAPRPMQPPAPAITPQPLPQQPPTPQTPAPKTPEQRPLQTSAKPAGQLAADTGKPAPITPGNPDGLPGQQIKKRPVYM